MSWSRYQLDPMWTLLGLPRLTFILENTQIPSFFGLFGRSVSSLCAERPFE